MKILALSLLISVISNIVYAGIAFQSKLFDSSCYSSQDFKISKENAKVSEPEYADKRISFSYEFGSGQKGMIYQAERTELRAVAVYRDDKASGMAIVGAFGDQVGDFMKFDVPDSNGLNFFYSNANPYTTQATLKVNDQETGKVFFEPTDSWHGPYKMTSFEGKVSGTVKLEITKKDFEKNDKKPAFNIDVVSTGQIKELSKSKVTIHIPLKSFKITNDIQSVSCIVNKSNYPIILELRAKNGSYYRTQPYFNITGQIWQPASDWIPDENGRRITALFEDFEPAITSKAIQDGFSELRLEIVGDGFKEKSLLEVSEIMFSKGWPNMPPASCPFEQSKDYSGISFTGREAAYCKGSDTYYPTWADDGNLYSPFTDGACEGLWSMSFGKDATTGNAKIIGDDPLNLDIEPLNVVTASSLPYGGRYPCGSLIHNGIWYYGTYCLDGGEHCGNWCVLGPFVGFRVSGDYGKTWIKTEHTPEKSLFGEKGTQYGEKVKIGAPHFVDFGENMEHSPDGKAYLIAHGATKEYAKNTWISGDQVYLVRVKPSPKTINDESAYEYFAGRDLSGKAKWTKDFEKIKPLFEWEGNTGCVTMTYNPGLRKYFTCVSYGWPAVWKFNTYILESDSITGPFRLVTYMENFGEQAYFVNIPSKFISEDGQNMWLCYAANFTRVVANPKISSYGMTLKEFKVKEHE